MNGYVLLATAIILEIISTSLMKASVGFSKLFPSLLFVICMGSCFFFLSKSLTTIPLGVAYALWSGLGTVLTVIIAVVIWHEHISITMIAGIAFIIVGVVLLNLRSA